MSVAPPAPRFSPQLRSLVVIAAAGAVALYAGFLHFSPKDCERLVRTWGYGWMFAVVIGFVAAFTATVLESGGWRNFAVRIWPGRGHAALIVGVWLWLLALDPMGYKILFDEPVQASTSFTLHNERELATTTRAFRINGMFTVLSAYLDKRPPMFPFLVATVHDLTGYRLANAFAVNAAGTLLLVGLVWHLGRRYGGAPAAGSFAAGLLATLPVLGITASSAGMDLFNLTLLVAAWTAVIAYVEQPSTARTGLLVATVVMLAYCRYESVLYVGAAAAAWLLVAWRTRSWNLPPIWALLPLSLVLYAWHNTMLSNSPALWELRPEQSHRFSLAYAPNNLDHAWRYLFALGWSLSNSAIIVVTGLAGGFFALFRLLQRRTALTLPEAAAAIIIGGGVAVSFTMLMCYYWGELDDPLVSRLSLPLHAWLVILAVAGWREVIASRPAMSWRWPAAVTGLALLAITVPAAARDRYTANNLLRKNFDWERRVVARFWPAPDLVISNRSPICWLADGIPAVSLDRMRLRVDELDWHLQRRSFGTVLVMQRVLTRGAEGGWVVDPTDALPARVQLEEVAVKRFGMTLTRVSRLVGIESPAVAGR